MKKLATSTFWGLVLCLAVARPTSAQTPDTFNDFVNFETPQTHPIEIVSFGGPPVNEFLAVCNTPDNSIAFYDIRGALSVNPALIGSVRTGFGPATVRFRRESSDATKGVAYVLCRDSDACATVDLALVPAQGGGTTLQWTLRRIDLVGDAPADIAISSDGLTALITHATSGSTTLHQTSNMAPLTGDVLLTTPHPFPHPLLPGMPIGIKMPGQILQRTDGRTIILNKMGDRDDPNASPGHRYDWDIFYRDPAFSANPVRVADVGTTNMAFAMNSAGTKIFVAASRAQNLGPNTNGVANISTRPFGFVESHMVVVSAPLGFSPVVEPESVQTSPGVWQTMKSYHLNKNYASGNIVLPTDAVSMPSAIELFENASAPDGVAAVFVAAYQSDKIVSLRPNASSPGGWSINRITLPLFNASKGYTIAGPRGFALSMALTDPNTPTQSGVLYVANRLNNSFAVINPNNDSLRGQFNLPQDPTPEVIRKGRQFLYHANFSGTKTVACGSCHIDGTTDGLSWDLGDLNPAFPTPIPPGFHDGNGLTHAVMQDFPDQKGMMVTQTLQGLVNYKTNREAQILMTNAPYHWRADKASFEDFNEAFHNLQGMPNIGSAQAPRGIATSDMTAYADFINTIVHPSNPKQPLDRRPTGTINTAQPNNPLTATGDRLGQMMFHNFPMVDSRSCVDCHMLPDGSTNFSSLTFSVARTIAGTGSQLHPFEGAALRNIGQREALLHVDNGVIPAAVTRSRGLLHNGSPEFFGPGTLTSSINHFVTFTFLGNMAGGSPTEDARRAEALVEFVRHFDTGIAPLAGLPFTVDPSNLPLSDAILAFIESQVAEANVGAAAYTRKNGVVRGYWFDVTLPTPNQWREEGSAAAPISRASLMAIGAAPGDVVIALATPLGSERRWANPSGVTTRLQGAAPSNIVMHPMAPNTFHETIGSFNGNLFDPPSSFTTRWSSRTLEAAVITAGTMGLTQPQHHAPRRFRVTGTNIRHGAKMLFAMSTYNPAAPIALGIFELYPTNRFVGADRIWETYQEVDGLMTLALLNGGLFRPEVVDTIWRTNLAPPLNPTLFNGYFAVVWNEDNTISNTAPAAQVLKVQNVR